MKHIKHWLAIMAMLLCCITASAHNFEIGGIYYNIISDAEAEVTESGGEKYSGNITIPATITYNGVQYSVTSIGSYAFSGCSSLTTINIPEGVTSIGDHAFSYCRSLTVINIPEGVTSIESYAFYGCSSLTAINIPEGVTSIGGRAFEDCSCLTAINIPEGVTSIGGEAFERTAWYNNQPDGVIYIGKVLYKYKGKMPENTSIDVREGTVSISPDAFYKCSSLTAITLPESVTSIGGDAFEGCSNLKTVINYSDLDIRKDDWKNGYVAYYADRAINADKIIDDYAFKTIDGVHYLTGYIGADTELTLPDDYKGENYQIENYTFYGYSSLTSISIPEGVTSIGSYAFKNCRSLTVITIPEGVTSIGESAFSYCSSLTTITLPESMTSIGINAFTSCSSLTAINIPEGVTSIGSHPFDYCYNLEHVTINCSNVREGVFSDTSIKEIVLGEGVTSIEQRAFSGCSGLTAVHISNIEAWCKIAFEGYASNPLYYAHNLYLNEELVVELVIPEGVTSIGERAFENCSSFTTVNIPEGVTSIGNGAFSGCESLTAINIPEGVTSIGNGAFSGCESLTAINIPEGVTSIESYAFENCSSLTTVNIPEGVTSIGNGAFYGCSSLTTINIPEGVTSIGDDAFYGCSNLTSINIPKGVTSIEQRTFYDCESLTAINIPEGVTSIGDDAFDGCSNLKTVINYSDLDIRIGYLRYGGVACYADRVINVDKVIGDCAFKTKDGVHYLTGYMGDGTEFSLPDNYEGKIYQIGERAFYKCSSLTAINIPESVTSIGSEALSGCRSLKELTLGKGLRKIETGAFSGCTALEKVTTYATRPPTAADGTIFSDATYENATLYVPQGCIDKYQVMTGWSGFYTIEQMEGGIPNYLTIRQADNGSVGIAVDLGRTYKVCITPSEGWAVHSVTFNGEDITAQLGEDNTLTTPTINGSAELNVAYEQLGGNEVKSTRANAIKVSGYEGIITVDGCADGELITIYTTDGAIAAQQKAEGESTRISVATGQLYIIKVADKVVKILM